MAYDLLLSPLHIRNFWAKVDKSDPGGCWLWTGWKNETGHPRFEVAGQKLLATHVSLILSGQPRPEPPNHYALHGDACISASCVRPEHLRWGTAKQNTEDRDRLGRRTPARGSRHANSVLTEAKVREIRASELPTRVLAERFGVSTVTIGLIRKGRAWKHVA